MKRIIIKKENEEKIMVMLNEGQKKARERKVTFEDVENAVKELNEKFSMLTKDEKEEMIVDIDPNHGTFPRAYRGIPESTQMTLTFSKGSWRLLSVMRYRVQKDFANVTRLSDIAKAKIISTYTKF